MLTKYGGKALKYAEGKLMKLEEAAGSGVSAVSRVERQIAKYSNDISELQNIIGESDTAGMMSKLRQSKIVGMADDLAGQGKKAYGVHWTSAKAEAQIFKQGRINSSYNDLLWFERAESTSQLKTILEQNGAKTGAKSSEVAIIVELTGLEPRITGGGGVAYRMTEGMQLNGAEGRGLTWYRNTGIKQHINKIADYVREGKNSYGR